MTQEVRDHIEFVLNRYKIELKRLLTSSGYGKARLERELQLTEKALETMALLENAQ